MDQTEKKTVPNPGSDEAVEQGCICPRIDNGHGKGIMIKGKRDFWVVVGCPLHCP